MWPRIPKYQEGSGENMANSYDFKKLRRLIMIQTAIQLFLLVLLVFMAVKFQGGLQAEGRPQRFLHTVITTLVIQLALFYPVNKLAVRDAQREIAAAATNLTVDEQKDLRQKRLYSDYLKGAVFIFYTTFAYLAPKNLTVLSVIFYSFILTFLTYFQCYNFAARRLMKEKS
jgi:Mn2+/Fe2+ NRAMP family transporter